MGVSAFIVLVLIVDRFTDIEDIKKEMLNRLEAHFEKRLSYLVSV